VTPEPRAPEKGQQVAHLVECQPRVAARLNDTLTEGAGFSHGNGLEIRVMADGLRRQVA
jgi:hypothetical protein